MSPGSLNSSFRGGAMSGQGGGVMATLPASILVRVPDTYAGKPVVALRFTGGRHAGRWCRVFFGKAGNPIAALATDEWRAAHTRHSKTRLLRAVRELRRAGCSELEKADRLEVFQRFVGPDGASFVWGRI